MIIFLYTPFLRKREYNYEKKDGRLISFATALAIIITIIPAFNIAVNAAVIPLPNRQVVYSIDNDQANDWEAYPGSDINHVLTDGVLTATNNGSDNRPIWRYFNDDIASSLSDQTNIEVEFDIAMTSYKNGNTFSIMGNKYTSSSDVSDTNNGDAIIMLKHDKSNGIVKINSNGATIMKSDNNNVIPKFRMHAVINFNTHSYNLTTYTLDENNNPTEYTTVEKVNFNSDISTIAGFFSRISNVDSNKKSSIELSNAKIFIQGESELTNTIYDLSTDIQDAEAENASSWYAQYGLQPETTMNDNNIVALKHTTDKDQHGVRNAWVQFESTRDIVDVEFSLNMKPTNDSYSNYFTLSDSFGDGRSTPVMADSILFIEASTSGVKINGKTFNEITANSNGEYIFDVSAQLNFTNHTIDITITYGESTDATQTINMCDTNATSVNYALSSMHRGDGVATMPHNIITNLVITESGIYDPVISKKYGDDTVKVSVDETLVIANVYRCDKIEVNSDNPEIATADVIDNYNTVTVTGKTNGSTSITIKATYYNGQSGENDVYKTTSETTININVSNETIATMPPAHTVTLEPIESQGVISIDFDDNSNNSPYKIYDEFGSTHNETGTRQIAKISDTNELTNPEPSCTPIANADNSPLSGKAFESSITPPTQNSEFTNGYRGSFLELDNELIQRTDKIKVSYDFAFYNIVNNDSGTDVGMPIAITLTSEVQGNGGIPYNFNSLAYDEIDADPSNLTYIKQHLLTFMSGRPKRDNDGLHWVDMTNTLSYYNPLYGRYVDLGISLNENEYNYFHVDAEIDFYDNTLTFTIKNALDDSPTASDPITIPIDENASWNGFILASNKWDKTVGYDPKGQDTAHAIYLDNIKVYKIAEDNAYMNPGYAPTERPIPTDAVIMDRADDSSTWISQNVYNMMATSSPLPLNSETPRTADDNRLDFTSDTAKNFTYTIVTGAGQDPADDQNIPLLSNNASANGITSYTEFDFYLPKEGSKFSLYLTGSKSNTEVVGNTIFVSTAGINSWTGNENYNLIYGSHLECGVWYHMDIVYDLNGTLMKVRVSKSDNNETVCETNVSSRNLSGGYYRSVAFNPQSITTGDNGETGDELVTFPDKEPSMAISYIANLRIYNRATIMEYYPEGTTSDAYGDAKNGESKANNTRLGGAMVNFVHNQVNSENIDDSTYYTRAINYPAVPPKNDEGKTFKGWKLIYSNGTNPAYPEDGEIGGTEGENATRLKYAAVYDDLPVTEKEHTAENGYYYKEFSTVLPIIEGNNFKTVDWFVYNNDEFRMKGSFDLTSLNLENFSGEGSYVIGYVVYNIPESYNNITALPQAHHDQMTEDELSQSTDEPHGSPEPMVSSSPAPSGAPAPTQDSEQ